MVKPEIIKGNLAIDDRGTVRFVNDFKFSGIQRFYQVENFQSGFIRAWHAHRWESKYVFVVKGSALVQTIPLECMWNLEKHNIPIPRDSINKFVLSSLKPQILAIPAGYANGYKTLEDQTIVQFFSNKTLEESLDDDIRFNHNICNIWQDQYR